MAERPWGQIVWVITRAIGFLLGLVTVVIVGAGGQRAQSFSTFPQVLPICIVILSILVNLLDFFVSAKRRRPVTLSPALGWLGDVVPGILLLTYGITILKAVQNGFKGELGWNRKPVDLDRVDLLDASAKTAVALAGIHLSVGVVDLAGMCGVRPYRVDENITTRAHNPPIERVVDRSNLNIEMQHPGMDGTRIR